MDVVLEPLVLFCPKCNGQHIDRDEWATKPHKTHLCEFCGHLWRPKETHTVGVERLEVLPERIETGVIQFGDDWPGVFIRGDDAFNYVVWIDAYLGSTGDSPDAVGRHFLLDLQKLLERSNVHREGHGPVLSLRSAEECTPTKKL